MKKVILAAVAAFALSGAAVAQPSCTANGNGGTVGPNCGATSNTTNNQGGTGIGGIGIGGNAAAAATNTNNIGVGAGNFSPSARVDADLRNTNNNITTQGQQQQQQQQMRQGQDQSSVNVNANKAVAGSDADSASSSQAKATNAGNTQGITLNTFNPGTIHYSGEYTIKSAPAIGIPGPASGACNGFSATVGASWIGAGVGGGVSLLDETCVDDRAAARFIHMAQAAATMGATALAQRYMQAAEDIQMNSEAYKRSQQKKSDAQPKPAPRAEAPAATPVRTAAPVAATPTRTAGVQTPVNCVSDEFIARRTGASMCK